MAVLGVEMKTIISLTDKDINGSEELSSKTPRLAVGVVLFDDLHNIALQYTGINDGYSLPGGGVDPGESLMDAAKRETWEECGCRCEILAELGKTYENSVIRNFVMERYFYLAKVTSEKGPLHLEDYEIEWQTEVRWYPMPQVIKLLDEERPMSSAEADAAADKVLWRFIRRRDLRVLQEVQKILAEKPGII